MINALELNNFKKMKGTPRLDCSTYMTFEMELDSSKQMILDGWKFIDRTKDITTKIYSQQKF